MSRKSKLANCLLAAALFTLAPHLLISQTMRPGGGPGYGQIIVSSDIHHDRSLPLREVDPDPIMAHRLHIKLDGPPAIHRGASGTADSLSKAVLSTGDAGENRSENVVPDLVNGSTGVVTDLGFFNLAGVGMYFNGPQGSFTPTSSPSDGTGAVGTTQYLQWVDDAFAIFNKATGNVVYGPVAGNTIWSGFGGPCQNDNDGQPTVNFDKLANRWVVSQYAKSSGAPYVQCVAVSTTADATGSWYRYSFQTGGYESNSFINENAKLGVWPDGYYMAFDMYSGATFEGDRICALQRQNMIVGAGAGIQCVQLETDYYGLVVSDLDGLTPPPTGAPGYFAAEDTYVYAIDLWKFHVDWNDSQNSTLSLPIALGTGDPTPACGPYSFQGVCVPQYGTTTLLDSYAGRLTGRLPYRNYGNHQSLFAAETDGSAPSPSGGPAAPTAVRFYEVRLTTTSDLYLYQAGTFLPDTTNFRFIPSISSDRAGNIAVAYNLSSSQTYPGQYAATRAAGDPLNTLGNETLLNPGNASQTTSVWDTRSSLTVDPVDDCTYYYTQQYEPFQGTNNWSTQIENFVLAGCQVSTVTLNTVPSGLLVDLGSGPLQAAPASGQFSIGSSLSIGTEATQAGAAGTQYVFGNWSDGGALTHNVTVPSTNTTYTANFTTQYQLTTAVGAAGTGTVTPASGTFLNSGSTVNLTATPSAGYAFSNWTGNVAKPNSASTSVVMSGPQTVAANFVGIPIVHSVLTSQSGPSSARVWTFTFTNSGAAEANAVTITGFQLTQTAGTACSPVVLTAIPDVVGNIAPIGTLTGQVLINFSSCMSNARFSLSMPHSVVGGATYTGTLTNVSQ